MIVHRLLLIFTTGRVYFHKMSKSFNRDKGNHSEKRDQYNNYKRRRNSIKEESYLEELSEYKFCGFKKKKSQGS